MSDHEDELLEDGPPTINPYEVLEISKTATSAQITAAYRKAALKNHPDKQPDHLKDGAHAKFLEIAFAYAVLSDPARRERYDKTGSTSESIIDADGFSWSDFYREQFRDVVSEDAIEKFAKVYKGSDQEKDDLLEAFKNGKGDMQAVYESVMLSNAVEDEDRFRRIIDEAIAAKEVKAYKAYTQETKAARTRRIKEANAEAKEAVEYAKELGVADKLYSKRGAKDAGQDGLKALIQKRQQDRSSFLDNLEAKYGGGKKASKTKKGTKRAAPEADEGEPSEEAFQAAAARLKQKKGTSNASEGQRTKRSKK